MTLCRIILRLSIIIVLITALICCKKQDSKTTPEIDSLIYKSASELTALIRQGEISSHSISIRISQKFGKMKSKTSEITGAFFGTLGLLFVEIGDPQNGQKTDL